MFAKLLTTAIASCEWHNLHGDSKALALVEAALQHAQPLLVITPDVTSANQLYAKLEFFRANANLAILNFPSWETLPYDRFSPHQDIVSERLLTLHKISKLKQGLVITAITTLLTKLAPPKYLARTSFILHKTETIDLKELRISLNNRGYYEVDQVLEHGEFAIRGSLIDIYPTGSNTPYRIDLFDEEIDTISEFDPETQLSSSEVTKIELLPAHEFPLDSDSCQLFSTRWQERFSEDAVNCHIYQNINKQRSAPGLEYYLPLFFPKTSSLLDYLSPQTLIIHYADLLPAAHQFWQTILNRYEQLKYDRSYPILEPHELFLTISNLMLQLANLQQIIISNNTPARNKTTIDFQTEPAQQLKLQALHKPLSKRVVISSNSPGRAALLLEKLPQAHHYQLWSEIVATPEPLGVIVAPLTAGFTTKDISVIPENELFPSQARLPQSIAKSSEQLEAISFLSLENLQPGDPVVHLNYGIGKYLGLETITSGDYTAEYLTLEYAGGAKLYVPITSLHLISRYIAPNAESVSYDTLGTSNWDRKKRKAANKIYDIAAELLDIYAQRAARAGTAFPKPGPDYQLFCASFPFELTADQQQALTQVIADMCSVQVMDRLICGDVGFGKTEIALRAAFIAASAGKQVAILAPTTLLVQQHYTTFFERFKEWPLRVVALSRFNSSSRQKQLIAAIAKGEAEIIIGTHRLLQNDIKFKELGLLVIDEEHRFGVRQKERIKRFRANVDILTLTATPIPRTLSMSLSGIRDLSIIATAPARRLAVKTFITEYEHNQVIKDAISRETLRGGQVFFLHNDVASIEQKARELQELLPMAQIKVAHGQMPKQQLEQIMVEFCQLRFNVLVCSTIIESGIDIATANTIIIERADKFGLAQLYQLRGRVGRSHHQAYAYLLTPPKKYLTSDAKRRLEAFAAMKSLGSGFSLASYDLEIRGAGELLGEEQSGQINSIGYNLYTELLNAATNSLQQGTSISSNALGSAELKIELQLPLFIPDSYIKDLNIRLNFYRRIAAAKADSELDSLQVELIDRFGLLPQPCKNLFSVTALKLLANTLGIKAIKATMTYGYLEFSEQPNIDMSTLLKLIQENSAAYKLATKTTLRFLLKKTNSEIIAEIELLLKSLA